MKNIEIFTSPTCMHCPPAKAYLESKGVDFVERNVSSDVEARKELMKRGIMGVPTIIIDNEAVVGFDKEKIDSLLAK